MSSEPVSCSPSVNFICSACVPKRPSRVVSVLLHPYASFLGRNQSAPLQRAVLIQFSWTYRVHLDHFRFNTVLYLADLGAYASARQRMKQRQYNKNYWQRLKADPERYARRIEYIREVNRKVRQRKKSRVWPNPHQWRFFFFFGGGGGGGGGGDSIGTMFKRRCLYAEEKVGVLSWNSIVCGGTTSWCCFQRKTWQETAGTIYEDAVRLSSAFVLHGSVDKWGPERCDHTD